MQKPFEDLIVLDLSRYLLGAYTSLFCRPGGTGHQGGGHQDW